MKILYLCTYYHRAMIFRNSMDCLMARGHELMAFNAVARGSEEISETYKKIMDDKVVHSECFNRYDRYFFFCKQRKIVSAIEKSLPIETYDLIHSHTLFNGGWAARNLKKKYGLRYVVSFRNTDLNVFLKIPFFRMIARRIVDDASGIQFLSLPYRDKFLDLCYKKSERQAVADKSVVITNGLEPFWLQNRASAPRIIKDSSQINLLCVGRIDRRKNVKAVLKVATILRDQGVGVKVTIIGPILDKELLEQIKLHKNIWVVPYQEKERLIDYYRNNDIYVMPSFKETFGRVYAEAMSQGVPVIYTRGQGFDGLFPEGHVGYSVLPSDIPAIVDAVQKICRDYEQISKNCIAECASFDWNQITDKLEAFYQKALR